MEIRERATTYGVNVLSNNEMVQLLTGVEIHEEIKNLNDLRDRIDLLKITDLQKLKLKSMFDFSTRINKSKNYKTKITSPDDAACSVMDELKHLKKEHFKILLLDTKNNIIKISEISIGSLNSSIVHPREVFKEAIINSSSSIILAHNHPSGESEPSHEDIVLTNRLEECGKTLGVHVIDHIIIGNDEYFSFKEEGLI